MGCLHRGTGEPLHVSEIWRESYGGPTARSPTLASVIRVNQAIERGTAERESNAEIRHISEFG
ncbi:hypothetical protein BUE80_DR001818 [Diplocarpon rosae]|nr:hypothetical protein BUE80_DR001818 [Diplocarpon rosae]